MKFIAYLQKFLDSTDATASLRNAAFALVMVSGVLFLGADLHRHGIRSDWNVALGILTTAATGSKLIGQKLTKPSGDDKDVKE